MRARAARPAALAAALLVCLYAAARLWRLGAACLWFDEIFSVHAARHAWGDLWRFAAADLIHPPLFYALLKIWVTLGGESVWWLRLLPALASVAALVPLLLLARELRLGARATNLALLLAAANGYLVKYAQEVRMYGLLLLLTLASLWLLARLSGARGGGRRATQAALFLVNLLLVYTHYYGWLVVASEAALLALRERARLRGFALGVAGLVLAYAPWVWACLSAAGAGGGLAQNIGWIERPGARDLVQLFALFNEPFYFRQSSADPVYARGGALFGLLLVGLPVVALAARSLYGSRAGSAAVDDGAADDGAADEGRVEESRRPAAGGDKDAVTFLLVFALLPVALAFVASYALPQSVWGTRHLVVAFGPYALLGGLALERLRPFWLKAAALTLLCCWFAGVGALTLARRDAPYVWCAWEGLAASAARDEARDAPGGPNVEGGSRVEGGPNIEGGSRVEGGSPAEGGSAVGGADGVGGSAAGGAGGAVGAGGVGGAAADVYAFEDLVAYHLWFALERGATAGRFRVVSVKGAPGIAEDPAYFLPRAFGGVAVAAPDALRGERFWVAFRDAAWDETRQPLRLLAERGYRAERVYETAAQGQRAFIVLFARDADRNPLAR